jgi:hypothetical protein
MSNRVDFGAFKRPTGFIAWFRLYHHGENRILREGRNDILFATEAEAEAAAKAEFLRQMNSKLVSESFTGPTTPKALAKARLDRIFQGGGETNVEREGEVA